MNFFTEEFERLHNDGEQMIRQERASDVEINWIPKLADDGQPILNKSGKPRRQYMINTRLKTCRIKDYLVSLESCTCRDFQSRRLPCKHMYKLAARLGLFVREDERSRELIADFSKGYADGWKFIVRRCHYESLDIKWQEVLAEGEKRGANSKKVKVLTQGNLYNFQRGYSFFDTMEAYETIWGEALKKIKYMLQIDYAKESLVFPVVEWNGNRFVRKKVPDQGLIQFSLHSPQIVDGVLRLMPITSYVCSPDEFVSLLKTGSFVDNDGEIITLEW